jgi:cellobiose phosphorylase
MLNTLAEAYERLGRSDQAGSWREQARAVQADFQRLLVVDEVLAGFAYFDVSGRIDYLLHPRDQHTGLRYSVLAMVHAISSEMFTPQQAAQHLTLIREHLMGPDGVRLFDRNMAYRGGPMRYFQRAESASFFGREIGLMYTHAHLRYAECLWRVGQAEAFFDALCKINPIGLQSHVPSSTRRQLNCYYSSSDACFGDRYQANEHYEQIALGEVALEGGWRIYSSGPGIALGLVLRCLLGLRWEHAQLVIDPVLPASLDGLRAQLLLAGHELEVHYRVAGAGCGPAALTLNGETLEFERGVNAYRTGAALLPMARLQAQLRPGVNSLIVQVGSVTS